MIWVFNSLVLSKSPFYFSYWTVDLLSRHNRWRETYRHALSLSNESNNEQLGWDFVSVPPTFHGITLKRRHINTDCGKPPGDYFQKIKDESLWNFQRRRMNDPWALRGKNTTDSSGIILILWSVTINHLRSDNDCSLGTFPVKAASAPTHPRGFSKRLPIDPTTSPRVQWAWPRKSCRDDERRVNFIKNKHTRCAKVLSYPSFLYVHYFLISLQIKLPGNSHFCHFSK